MDLNDRNDFLPAPVGILIRPSKEPLEANPERWVDATAIIFTRCDASIA